MRPRSIPPSMLVLALLTASACGNEKTNRSTTAGQGTSASSTATPNDTSTATATATGTEVTGDDEIATFTTDGTSFSIFKYEASIVGGKARSLKGVAPAVSVNFEEAKTACEAAGYRLCKQAEWQSACQGPDKLLFAYAATKDGPPKVEEACDVARTSDNTPGSLPSLTGAHAACVTKGLDVYDMVGNASEWAYDANNQPFSMGVAFYQDAAVSNCDGGINATATEQSTDVGFRCCK